MAEEIDRERKLLQFIHQTPPAHPLFLSQVLIMPNPGRIPLAFSRYSFITTYSLLRMGLHERFRRSVITGFGLWSIWTTTREVGLMKLA
jgi:hypothetical protein